MSKLVVLRYKKCPRELGPVLHPALHPKFRVSIELHPRLKLLDHLCASRSSPLSAALPNTFAISEPVWFMNWTMSRIFPEVNTGENVDLQGCNSTGILGYHGRKPCPSHVLSAKTLSTNHLVLQFPLN